MCVSYFEDAGFALHAHVLVALVFQLPGPATVDVLAYLDDKYTVITGVHTKHTPSTAYLSQVPLPLVCRHRLAKLP